MCSSRRQEPESLSICGEYRQIRHSTPLETASYCCKYSFSISSRLLIELEAPVLTYNNPTATSTPQPDDQRKIHDYVNLANPYEQALHGKITVNFIPHLNNLLILDWLVDSNLPLAIVDNPKWRRQQQYNNPTMQLNELPHSKTFTRLLLDEYERALPLVRTLLQTARGMIHITFDGWTSRRNSSFLGINAHFVDKDWKQWKILLGLPQMLHRHTGEVTANEVINTLRFFGILDKLGYSTLDNEAKNGTTMEYIGQYFGADGIEYRDEYMIRCAPHYMHLAVRAMLYGDGTKRLSVNDLLTQPDDSDFSFDDEAVITALQETEDNDQDVDGGALLAIEEDKYYNTPLATAYPVPTIPTADAVATYSKRGPFGKLHNLGNAFSASSQLAEIFAEAQRQIHPEYHLNWVQNVTTRWQSDEAMAARAIKERESLNRMFIIIQQRYQDERDKPGATDSKVPVPEVLSYKLTPTEWLVVERIQKVLLPFKVASKQLQGNGVVGVRSTTGAFEEYFPFVESLLDHLERCARGDCIVQAESSDRVNADLDQDHGFVAIKLFDGLDPDTRKLLKVYIRFGWYKLDEYYNKLNSLAYAAAVIMHPCLKFELLDELWNAVPSRQAESWKKDYSLRLRKR